VQERSENIEEVQLTALTRSAALQTKVEHL